LDGPGPKIEPGAQQLALPEMEPPAVRAPRRQSRPPATPPGASRPDDPLLTTFTRRLAAQGRVRKGQKAYQYQMRSMLATAERMTGQPMTFADLLRDEELLGRVLVHDVAPTLGTRLSKWTLAQRRSAIRTFTALMRPELLALFEGDPHDRLDRALRAVAERSGAAIASPVVPHGDAEDTRHPEHRSEMFSTLPGASPATSALATASSSRSWPRPARGSTRCDCSTEPTASSFRPGDCGSSSTRRAGASRVRPS
jgi:hypothetical protein